MTIAQDQCENHFNKNKAVNENGRFLVPLPFANGPEKIFEPLNIAATRFFGLEHCLFKDASLRDQYAKCMKENEVSYPYDLRDHSMIIWIEVPSFKKISLELC